MRKFRVQGHTARWLQAILLATSLFTSQQLLAMTFTVDDTADAVDAAPGDGLCATAGGTCTLRAAVQEANAWPGADVIRLQPGKTYTLTLHGANENKAATGDLDILDDVTINGAGASNDPNSPNFANATIIDGDGADRVLDILNPAASVIVSGVIVKHGQLNGSNVTGAGINNAGNLTINDSLITSNDFGQLQGGGGGGGIAISQGTLTINHSNISGNRASGFAGINVSQGKVDITDSSIIGNQSQGSGGGMGINNGTVTITNSTISANSGGSPGGEGGGINNGGNLTLIGSTVDNNTGVAQGGGIANVGTGTINVVNSSIIDNTAEQGNGGGILSVSNGNGSAGSASTLNISNSTIAGNVVKGFEDNKQSHIGYGGGLFYAGTTVTLRNTIIANNANAQANLGQGDNCSEGKGAPTGVFASGTLDSRGYNVAGDTSCPLSGTGDQTNTDPLLAAVGGNLSLSFNGGPTRTVALSSGSPAIDRGNPGGCTDANGAALTQDQRDYPRPDGVSSLCDVGAFEVQQSGATLADLGVHVTEAPRPVDPNTTLTYTATVTNHGTASASGITLTDVLPAGTSFNSGSGCALTNTTSAGVQTISCTVGAISAGSAVPVIITAKVAANATGTLTNQAAVSGNETDLNPANDSDTTHTPVNLTADLQATVSASPDPAILNKDDVVYTITVTYPSTGAGISSVPGVKLIDNLPNGATLVSNSTKLDGTTAAGGACTENAGAKTIICSLGPSPDYTMAPGDSHTITFTVKPTVAGHMTNYATVNFDGTDDKPGNNRISTQTSVTVQADVGVTITDNPDPVQVNNDLLYILNVTNNGPSPSSDVKVTATLPANVTFDFVSSSRGSNNCSNSGATVTCDLKGMADASQATVTIFVTPTALGSLQFSASVSLLAGETDPDTSNNTATANTQVDISSTPTPAKADLVMALSSSPNPLPADTTLTYTLKVTNSITSQASDDAGNVIAVLTLPASVNVTLPSGGTCTKDQSTNVVRCSLGTVAAGKSATTTVGVTPTQAGVLTASASVNFAGTDPDKSNNTATTATTVTAATSTGGSKGKSGALGGITVLTLLLLYAGALLRRRA